ncbi:hypothetical protein SanJ4211_0110c [Streptococcus anginosus]|uniref:hypothetical protein n=1 Tax=Streptococcus anginosus TaxID=1328 RepID=UPI0007058853|nr:hypothetical protein [Streptococcus anginosus]ALL02197.1 hypothetical protein SanJ4211_0110c [Streptococcus anginosus]QBX22392.1 hypothetical protein Javan73_0003 [Streptococcus phage Javan73]
MALFGNNAKKQAKLDVEKEKYYMASREFYEEADMLNIWEKYPEHVAQAGNIMKNKLYSSLTANSANLYEMVQIQQNWIKIKQNEEIIELLKNLNK